MEQGAAVSIEQALQYPRTESYFVLIGSYAAGWRIDATDATVKDRDAASQVFLRSVR